MSTPCEAQPWHRFLGGNWHHIIPAENGGWYIDGMLFTQPKEVAVHHYFCSWDGGGDSSHTAIKRGADQVAEWVRHLFADSGIGCPAFIAEELDTLDADSGHVGLPIKIVWLGDDCTLAITEIEELGDLAPSAGPEAPRAAQVLEMVGTRLADAQSAVEAAQRLLGGDK